MLHPGPKADRPRQIEEKSKTDELKIQAENKESHTHRCDETKGGYQFDTRGRITAGGGGVAVALMKLIHEQIHMSYTKT